MLELTKEKTLPNDMKVKDMCHAYLKGLNQEGIKSYLTNSGTMYVGTSEFLFSNPLLVPEAIFLDRPWVGVSGFGSRYCSVSVLTSI